MSKYSAPGKGMAHLAGNAAGSNQSLRDLGVGIYASPAVGGTGVTGDCAGEQAAFSELSEASA